MKKLVFGVLVAATAMGGSALTYASTFVKNVSGKAAPAWYRFEGGAENLPENYTVTANSNGCGGGGNLCKILAEPGTDPSVPDLGAISESSNKN